MAGSHEYTRGLGLSVMSDIPGPGGMPTDKAWLCEHLESEAEIRRHVELHDPAWPVWLMVERLGGHGSMAA